MGITQKWGLHTSCDTDKICIRTREGSFFVPKSRKWGTREESMVEKKVIFEGDQTEVCSLFGPDNTFLGWAVITIGGDDSKSTDYFPAEHEVIRVDENGSKKIEKFPASFSINDTKYSAEETYSVTTIMKDGSQMVQILPVVSPIRLATGEAHDLDGPDDPKRPQSVIRFQ
jgi:hypothetical protein